MTTLSRRHFLRTAGAVTVGFSGLQVLFLRPAGAAEAVVSPAVGFGELVPDPAGIMALPKGFGYRIIARVGQRMSDGLLVPSAADGMAAFPGPAGRTILICNHEVNADASASDGPFGAKQELLAKVPAGKIYDAGTTGRPMLGGTTTLVLNAAGEVESSRLSLAGTIRNCAGGPTPWNSWVTCEETTLVAGGELARSHGYNFEVPASTAETGLADPVPLKGMGRFEHEAIAVDPYTGVVYQTEDKNDGIVTRYLPNVPGALHKGGRLQALAIRGMHGVDLRNWEPDLQFEAGRKLETEWIDCDGADSQEDDLRLRMVEKGAAIFARGEGMWFGNRVVYFACTNGGIARKGQIWKYTPGGLEGKPGEKMAPGVLELFAEPNDGSVVENADNLTVAPWGDVIVCEDRAGDARLIGVTPSGRMYQLGRNIGSSSELAGVCFSPDGRTLFVNVQVDGLTLAITGPWGRA